MRICTLAVVLALAGLAALYYGRQVAEQTVDGIVAAQPKAGLLETAAAMRALDVWVKEKDGRQCQVTYTWDSSAGTCRVRLTEGERTVVTEAPDLPSAAKDALGKWKE